jgi:hypothetical protein
MAVFGLLSLTLTMPDLEAGIRFYTDAALLAARQGDSVEFRNNGQKQSAITLLSGVSRGRTARLGGRSPS